MERKTDFTAIEKQNIIANCKQLSIDISMRNKWTENDAIVMYFANCSVKENQFMIPVKALEKLAFDIRTPQMLANEYQAILRHTRDAHSVISSPDRKTVSQVEKYRYGKGISGWIQRMIVNLMILIDRLKTKQEQQLKEYETLKNK